MVIFWQKWVCYGVDGSFLRTIYAIYIIIDSSKYIMTVAYIYDMMHLPIDNLNESIWLNK